MAWSTPRPTAGRDSSTRSGREDRRRLEAAQSRYDAVAAEQGQRQAWFEAHADPLAYRDELAEAIAKRRRELGVAAAVTQPDHVVELIGAAPTDNPASLLHWTNMAGRIEAYREEWGVAPQQLRERPLDACQARDWDVAVHMSESSPGRQRPPWTGASTTGLSSGSERRERATTSSPEAELGVQCPAADARGRQGCAPPDCVRP